MPPARPARPTAAEIVPLTPERWPDLARLFGAGGDCAGCWCMWFRLARPAYDAGRGDGHRRALEAIVRGGTVPGLLAYVGGEPAGWVAVEPREAYPRVYRSRLLKPAGGEDTPGTWAITCFVVGRGHRGRGLTGELVAAAVAHARAGGARAVEAYPVVAHGGAASAAYHGTLGTFVRAGFEVVARPSPGRAVVRMQLGRGRARAGGDTAAGGVTAPPAPAARGRAPGRSKPRRTPRRSTGSRRGR